MQSSGNWVVDNIVNALNTWNEKMAEIWQLVSQSPQSFKGGTAGVRNFLRIGRNGGAGKYKLSQFSTMVDLKSNRIPKFGRKLPFVDQSRCFTL